MTYIEEQEVDEELDEQNSGGVFELDDEKREIVVENLPLVHFVVSQLSRKLSDRAQRDEMVSAGTIGLIGAVRGFDPSRGLAFSTFAAPRIRGAILDDLRRQDHVPRSVRRKGRDLEGAREKLRRETGREATDEELAEELGVNKDTVWSWKLDVDGATRVDIDGSPKDVSGTGKRAPSLLQTLGSGSLDALELLGREEELEILKTCLGELKEQERLVLVLSYFEELKLGEIAKVLKVTESRVSQIRSKAVARLRSHMTKYR